MTSYKKHNLYLLISLLGTILFSLGLYIYNNIPNLDYSILKLIINSRSAGLTELSFICSWLGSGCITTFTIIVASILCLKKRWYHLTEMVLSVILSTSSCAMLKALIMRPRPLYLGFDALVDEPFFSFPSGHTTGSAAFTLAFLIVFWQTPLKLSYKITCTVLGALFMLSVAWSRLYNGVHFPSDIIGSFGLATFFCFATLYAVESLRKQN